jgi:DNA polymerase I-like protein with 3'-5' exonuclease and polymerase domains
VTSDEQWVRTGKTKVPSLAADDLALTLGAGAPQEKFVAMWRAYQLGSWQLRTLVRPWLERVTKDGRVHVSWDTTRNAERGKLMGARTGRLSSTPNFQNVGKADPPGGLSNPRTWIKAPRGMRLVGGDVKSHEPRLMAHFGGGRMLAGYQENPLYDPHADVAELMSTTRPKGKELGLAAPYGHGVPALARKLGVSYDEAWALKRRFWAARPELKTLMDDLQLAWATGKAIVTWAGAEVKVEPTPEEPGKWAYRALNTLIQRSAAEHLKAMMIHARAAGVPLCLSVHDELVACVPRAQAPETGKALQDALEHTGEWRVPFVADVKIGTTWRSLK